MAKDMSGTDRGEGWPPEARWGSEFVLIDVTDAFTSFGVRKEECDLLVMVLGWCVSQPPSLDSRRPRFSIRGWRPKSHGSCRLVFPRRWEFIKPIWMTHYGICKGL